MFNFITLIEFQNFSFFETPLILALRKNKTEIAKLLLDQPNIDVNKTIISMLLFNNGFSLHAEFVLSMNLWSFICLISFSNALHEACRTQNQEIVDKILELPNVDINCKTQSQLNGPYLFGGKIYIYYFLSNFKFIFIYPEIFFSFFLFKWRDFQLYFI